MKKEASAIIQTKFPGIAKFNALLIFMALASSPLAFFTNGFLGKITFFLLTKIGNWLAVKGLALANMGVDALIIAEQEGNYEQVMDEAIDYVHKNKHRLTEEEKRKIDEKVKDAFRDFAPFTN